MGGGGEKRIKVSNKKGKEGGEVVLIEVQNLGATMNITTLQPS